MLYSLHEYIPAFRVFRFITMRMVLAVLTSLVISLLLGPWLIRKLQELQIGQHIQEDGPASHHHKAGTPTMGGLLILLSVTIACLLWSDLTSMYTWVALLTTLCFGLVGLADDYLKVVKKRNLGLRAREKFLGQLLIAAAVGVFLVLWPGYSTRLSVPFFKGVTLDLGWFYVLFAMVVIIGTSNAVNLTDGLDGLAIGPVVIAAGTYMIFAYLTGNVKAARYLQIIHVAGTGEVAVFCAAVVGAGIGFLWYNSHPAEIFMGDVGSLSLGAALGVVALLTKHELLLLLVGGLFVVEALSVIFQVGYFKATNGKRIFLMAPLHHHFEHKGWAESKVTVRFWIIAVILALLAFSTLKLR